MTRASLSFTLALGLSSALILAQPRPAAAQTTNPESATYCAETRFCGSECSNTPFQPTLCWTTPYGPARANVIRVEQGQQATQSTNMLYCPNGDYALCFFSGPPDPTGKSGAGNKALPCIVEEGGKTALCTCRAFSAGPYFVDIHAIENLGAYYQTVDACGPEGQLCQNIANCGPTGDKAGCDNYKLAPVCGYVAGQNAANPDSSLIPGADLISTFSFAMSGTDGGYTLGNTDCGAAAYAGCMTAPCSFLPNQGRPVSPLDGQPVECRCPIWSGPYQIGQTLSPEQCAIPHPVSGPTYVWSAAYTVAYETEK
ncbi:MAG: hypothetical protein HC897_04145 [Thermoanaerobaculia bacterium]|nr:hypothetical protein [Thermoanaerobaculia bacterium]